jgi:hypothetical protein
MHPKPVANARECAAGEGPQARLFHAATLTRRLAVSKGRAEVGARQWPTFRAHADVQLRLGSLGFWPGRGRDLAPGGLDAQWQPT